jgi:IS30 family transposase
MGLHQLTYRERYLIVKHKSSGESLRAMATMVEPSPSTIDR